MATKKTITFHICKTQVDEKIVLLQPPFSPRYMFFQLGFFKPKTIVLNKKHNLKSGNSQDKKKGFETKNKTGPPPLKKREKIDEETFCN